MSESRTPTLDKYGLHPFGGYPALDPTLSDRVRKANERWANLSDEDRQKAEREIDTHYGTSNQDGR